ncbi:patatin family protein [Collinsella sp. AGMB00827]|uniref:Patatin family protein n=1 Tax=Collinsella ureilytica TaxID=2869515 RepID=A0ABS7MIU8_9ACTN|nr:patatin family protein [Collinsella urealyticum]MBY4797295.1 patatin family protein [Collinsella urealyticum]
MNEPKQQTESPEPRRSGGIALVLEGGSYRIQFSSGVLDVLMEHGLAFDACYGVSAGTLAGMSLKSRQIGRSNRISIAFCNDPRYIGARSLLTSGSIVGYDFMFTEVQDHIDPFDAEAFCANPMQLFGTVTNILFGSAEYLPINDPVSDLNIVRASTSLPIVTPPVQIGASSYLDGGIADSVPVEHVLEEAGYDRTLVILTQHRSFVKEPYELPGAARARYTAYPYLIEALLTRHERYNEQREHICDYERAGKAFVIAPEEPVDIGHMEHDPVKLLELYIKGRQAGERYLEEIRTFLGA